MASTEEATVLLLEFEDISSDASQATPRQTLSPGSPLTSPTDGNNQNQSHDVKPTAQTTTNYGAVDTTGVTRNHTNHTSSPPAYRPGTNPDGTHVIHITDGGQVIPDINVYQQKKSLAQGMMDLALLSANANQLRYVLESCQNHPFFYVNLVLISTSIFIQVAVGFGLIWKSQYNLNNQSDFRAASRINNLVSIGIFIITLVNVMISAFNIAEISKS
ncbi:ninjurin-A-like [Anopheles marshallii]|uniref:ninjurin-A-like n=1 Tax=Anopheles marshallii TaxID=1521116 RepID=UPI00237A6EDB|nr:ninjurin-A-like [Anopheles marshallii]